VKPGKVRPLAICVFRRGERILAAEGYDSARGETFYRPLGGRIEFGEYSHQTVAREVREEIGAEVKNLRYLGTLENVFTYNGQPGHEIVLVYDGDLVDEALYERETITGHEGGEGVDEAFTAMWKTLDFFKQREAPLYPSGLLELLLRP
jgi:8-oxo-dGTP pyrophosphatase MutT (NUDIX family)